MIALPERMGTMVTYSLLSLLDYLTKNVSRSHPLSIAHEGSLPVNVQFHLQTFYFQVHESVYNYSDFTHPLLYEISD